MMIGQKKYKIYTLYANKKKKPQKLNKMNAYEFIVKMKDYASSQLKQVANSVGVASRKAKDFIKDLGGIEKESQKVSGGLGKLKSALVGVFALATIQSFAGKVVEARAEFEKFDAVLTNTFQSKEIGSGALAMLTDFAAKTPYQLNELTGGFIKLVNRGVYPTYQEMTKLGDLASSQGKSFDQLVEALLDAQTGEFERMKEFGIKASKSGDTVKLTFKGVTKEVKNNEQAIKDAIIAYGGMKGVAGSMEVVSKTLGGQISNLKDQWNNFLVAVGGYGSGIFIDALGGAADVLNFLQDNLPYIAHWFDLLWGSVDSTIQSFKKMISSIFELSDTTSAIDYFANAAIWALVGVELLSDAVTLLFDFISNNKEIVYGVAAAFLTYNAILSASALVTSVMTWWTGASTAAIILNTLVTEGWSAAWLALNIVMSANPIGAVIAIIALLVGVVVFAWNKFGWFRGAVLGTWEVLKGFGTMIKNYVINRFTELLKGITGIGQALVAFFKGDWKTAWEIGKKSAGELIGTGSAAQALKAGKAAFGNFNKGWEEGNRERKKDNAKESGFFSDRFAKIKNSFKGLTGTEKGNANDYLSAVPGLSGKGMAKDGSADSAGKKGSKKGDGITDGGNRLTNITININKLQDQTVINVDKTERGLQNLGDKVQEILLRAVNSANQMQTG